MSSPENRPLENQNSTVSSIAILIVLMAAFVGGVWVLSFIDFTTIWPMAVLLVVFTLVFLIPMTFMGTTDNNQD